MNPRVVVVDDLYDIPHQYHKGFDEGQCVITDETVGKISQILGNPIRVAQASNEMGTNSGVVAHLECDWIAVIYMTLPLEAFGEMGIRFYSHLPTGLETFPTKEEIAEYQIDQNELGKVFASDPKMWKEYGCVLAKYNRVVLFKGNQWHSYNLSSGIKYQKIIINNG